MTPGPQADGPDGAQAIDPISRQILQRTVTQHRISQSQHNAPIANASVQQDDTLDGPSVDCESLQRVDTGISSRTTKDKKKGVSFLSRIMGGKKKDGDGAEIRDNVSEVSEYRSGGNDAEVFSQPVGFIPSFPAPPRYIRVKTHNRRKRDLDRLFLAQVLLDPQPKSKRSSVDVDAKIVGIGDTPAVPPPNSSRKTNNAIWAAEFSKDGKYFAAAGQDKILRVWEVISSKEARESDEEQAGSNVNQDQRMRLNAPVFKQKLVKEYEGHTAAILDLSWSKNNFLLSSSMDKSVRLYHVSRDECLCSFKHNDFVTSIQFHPRDDRFFLAGSLDSKLRLWSIPDKSVAYWAQVPDMVTAVAFTPDGKTAIAGCFSGVCILYNTEGLKAHSQIHVRSTRGRNTKGSKITGIDTIAIPHDQGHMDVKVLITSNDSRVRVYNLKDRTLETKFRGNENSCSQIRASFSDDGRFVICGSEDRKVYVWPTGPVEKSDADKRPVEVFEAHSQIVTTALFAPANVRKALGQSGDPIYDICNPPPVVLHSRTDSMLSSPANTNGSGQSDEQQKTVNTAGNINRAESPPKPTENPAYQARQSHSEGHIIVTADYSGQIKVFRQDCAYQKRRDINWDAGSNLSRKMNLIGRSGSLTKRSSITSSNRRNSLNISSKSSSADRIVNWRDSITSTSGTTNTGNHQNNHSSTLSEFNFRKMNDERDRSSSPRKSISQRLSQRYNSTPLSNSSSPSSPARLQQPPDTPDITLQSPDSSSSHLVNGGSEHGISSPPWSASVHQPLRSPSQLSPVGEASPISSSQKTPDSIKIPTMYKSSENERLALVGDQSYMAWDVQNTLAPMIQHQPRTPGNSAGHGSESRNPISRTQSMISRLSSELGSSELSSNGGAEKRTGMGDRKVSMTTAGETDEEELKCKHCGSEKFKMVKVQGGGRGLKCRGCKNTI